MAPLSAAEARLDWPEICGNDGFEGGAGSVLKKVWNVARQNLTEIVY
jgi:hypothetical protein